MENEIYEDMRDTENLDRLRDHGSATLVDLVSLSGGNIALENY